MTINNPGAGCYRIRPDRLRDCTHWYAYGLVTAILQWWLPALWMLFRAGFCQRENALMSQCTLTRACVVALACTEARVLCSHSTNKRSAFPLCVIGRALSLRLRLFFRSLSGPFRHEAVTPTFPFPSLCLSLCFTFDSCLQEFRKRRNECAPSFGRENDLANDSICPRLFFL